MGPQPRKLQHDENDTDHEANGEQANVAPMGL